MQLTDDAEAALGRQRHEFWNGRYRSWQEIAMDVLGEKDSNRFRQLLEELEIALAAREAHKAPDQAVPSSCPAQSGSTHTGHEDILDAAVEIMRSDYASLQALFPERGTGGQLRLVGFRGFNPQAARFWEWVRADSKSTCGMALRDSKRVVAPDIAACDFMADSDDQQVYLQTGIYACQTTPLISRRGNIVGMISTHWRSRHQPSPTDLRQFDILAAQAAELIERSRQRGKL